MIEKLLKKFPWALNTDIGLLVLRLGIGLVFVVTGWTKITNMESTIGFFASLGLVAFWAYLVAVVELLGGIVVLLGVGIYTRLAAKLLAFIMLVVIYLFRDNFSMNMAPVILFFSALALMFTGSGRYSILREKNNL